MTDDTYQRVVEAVEYWDTAWAKYRNTPIRAHRYTKRLAKLRVDHAENRLCRALTRYDQEDKAAIVNGRRYAVEAGHYLSSSNFVACYDESGDRV